MLSGCTSFNDDNKIAEKVNIQTNSQPKNEAPVISDSSELTEVYKTSVRESQERLPKVHILYENKEIAWMIGNSNFTGKAGGVIGNTSFGWRYEDILASKGTKIKPKGKMEVIADEVKDLEKPKIQVFNICNLFKVIIE